MTNFSYIKALEAEVADLKAELVELSAQVPSDGVRSPATDSGPRGILLTAASSVVLGLVAGYLLGGQHRPLYWRT